MTRVCTLSHSTTYKQNSATEWPLSHSVFTLKQTLLDS